jgi:alpha-glucosidase
MTLQIMMRILLVYLVLLPHYCTSQQMIQLSSPDQRILFSLKINEDGINYDIHFNKAKVIIDAGLSMTFQDGGTFQKSIKAGNPEYKSGTESYSLIVGKTKTVKHHFNELRIPVIQTTSPFHRIDLLVRVFNDGAAFRYEFPEQEGWKNFELSSETSSFTPFGNPGVLTLQLPNYTSSHEGEYTSGNWHSLKEDTLMDVPTLLVFPQNIYLAITEAALVNYAGMYLVKHNDRLISKLSPLPSDTAVMVKAALPFKSPWRVLLIGDRIGTLIESNIITSLNEPNKIKDTSWIKPGKTTFPWWNGSIIPDTTFFPGNNFENNKYYIDFCARNGIEFHSVVESEGHEWYVNDGASYQPGSHYDVTKPVPGLDMQKVCDYAKQRGVDIRVWVHWKALYAKLDTALALFEKWGIRGMMVDFMDRDDQEMVNIQQEILQKSADHKIHIQFHGAYKPTGISRTYPNEFAREGTLNYEVNKWDKKVTPDHDLNIVFTRMLAGSTDYHLGGFRAVPDSLFQVQYKKPLMMGTRCHMLAMYVVVENYLGMVCDYPAAYEGQPGFDFIKIVPTVWDETKVLDAKLHEYVAIARRKSNDWFVGAINNHDKRTITLNLNFLGQDTYLAEIYTDAADALQNPNRLVKRSREISKLNKLSLNLSRGGGAVIHLKKQ